MIFLWGINKEKITSKYWSSRNLPKSSKIINAENHCPSHEKKITFKLCYLLKKWYYNLANLLKITWKINLSFLKVLKCEVVYLIKDMRCVNSFYSENPLFSSTSRKTWFTLAKKRTRDIFWVTTEVNFINYLEEQQHWVLIGSFN